MRYILRLVQHVPDQYKFVIKPRIAGGIGHKARLAPTFHWFSMYLPTIYRSLVGHGLVNAGEATD